MNTKAKVIRQTIACEASALDAGDTLFNNQEIPDFFGQETPRSLLRCFSMMDRNDQKPTINIMVSNRPLTFGVLDAAPSIADDAMDEIFCAQFTIGATDWVDYGGTSCAEVPGLNRIIERHPTAFGINESKSIWISGFCPGTPTFASGTIKVLLQVEQDY